MKESSRNERLRLIWEKRLKDWRSSGMSQAAYCRRNGIRPKSFAYWKKKEGVPKKEVRFVPVSIPQEKSTPNGSPIRVSWGEKFVIEIKDGFTPSTLRAVVHALAGV